MRTEEGLCFDRGFLGASLYPSYLEVLGNPLKNVGPTDGCMQQFQGGFGHYTDQNMSFKRLKQMGKLWEIMDWKSVRDQNNELIVPGQI